MVLSLFVGVTLPLATRSPLFVGEVLIDAGAENSPLLPLISFLLLTCKLPENEYGGCRWFGGFPFLFLKERNGLTNLKYLFITLLISNLDFLFSFSLASEYPFLHLGSPNREKDFDFPLPFASRRRIS